jgi:hypothetical protein
MWIDAAIYYCNHFQVVKHTVDSMKTEDARATEAAQEQFLCSKMKGQLAFTTANFSSLTEGIHSL